VFDRRSLAALNIPGGNRGIGLLGLQAGRRFNRNLLSVAICSRRAIDLLAPARVPPRLLAKGHTAASSKVTLITSAL